MTMTDLDIAELRELAENATPGPWEWEPPSGEDWPVEDETLVTTWSEDDGCPKSVVSGWGYDASGTEAEPQDRAFIATFNPAAVLALLDRLESAEAAIERVRAKHQPDWSDWGIDHPEEGASCSCGANYSYDECPTRRALDTGKEKNE